MKKRNTWLYLVTGSLIGFIIAILANLLAVYIQEIWFGNAFSTVRIWIILLITVIGLIITIWINKTGRVKSRLKLFVVILYICFSLLLFLCQGFCGSCPYTGETDSASIIKVIEAECEAVLKEDISIIKAIFDKNAIIKDMQSGEIWKSPIARYEALFANTDFIHAEQFEIQPKEIDLVRNTAIYTSGSKGELRIKQNPNSTIKYDNPKDSNEWTLIKNDCGCWVIKCFRFNISQPDS